MLDQGFLQHESTVIETWQKIGRGISYGSYAKDVWLYHCQRGYPDHALGEGERFSDGNKAMQCFEGRRSVTGRFIPSAELGTIAAAAVINEIIAVIAAKKGFELAGENE